MTGDGGVGSVLAVGGDPAVGREGGVAVGPTRGEGIRDVLQDGKVGRVQVHHVALAPGANCGHEGGQVSCYFQLALSIVEGSHCVDDCCEVIEGVHGRP